MDDGTPSLGVGFEIDTGGSFDGMTRLDGLIDTVTANALKEFAKVEQASKGMLNLGGATASVTAFGNATTREARNSARELAKVEKAGESLARQLERQASTFGMTRKQMRGMKAEAAALAAEQQGLTELAGRLRAAEQSLYDQEFAAARRARIETEALAEEKQRAALAAEIEARAIRDAASAHAIFEAKARQGIVAMREQESAALAAARAEEQMAAAAARLKASVDPLGAGMDRVNGEMSLAKSLYDRGTIDAVEYARAIEVLTDRMQGLKLAQEQQAAGIGKVAGSSNQAARALAAVSIQVPDVISGLATGQKPMTIFIQQGLQIAQVAQMAEGGIKGFATSLFTAALPFAPLIAAVAVAGAGLALFTRAISSGVDTTAMVSGLGLTHQEIKKLKDVSVSTGDVVTATFQVLAKNVGINLSGVKTFFADAMDFLTVWGRRSLAALYAQFVGTFRAIGAIVSGVFSGKGIGEIMADVGNSYKGAFDEADAALIRFGKDVTKQAASNKLADLQKQAAKIKADRTPKTDSHAQTLEREAKAVEAQIRNLYALATAYRVSDAAALIAEARVKAESQAIKARGDIEEAVNRQVRLAIAQRVSDGEKAAAAVRNQATAQEQLNGMVLAGLVPAARAAELVRDRIADLPLLQAIEAAQQRGLAKETVAATQALADQRAERERLKTAEIAAQFAADMAAAADRLDMLRLEARLIGETDAARVRSLATLQALQEAQAKNLNPAQLSEFLRVQVAIATQTQANQVANDNYNASLRVQAELLDAINDNAQNAAQGMADAFGRAGAAIGDTVALLTSYSAREERLALEKRERIKAAGGDAKTLADIEKLYATKSATAQIGLMGDITASAKGFFSEKSKGYKAIEAAEKAFRLVEFALSAQSIIVKATETAAKLPLFQAQTAAATATGAANMFATLGPAGFAAVAAMVAVMATFGFKGGSGGAAPATNEGKGTVFGDSSAKSDSIKRSIDLLGDIDTDMLAVSRQMAASLKNIESQISGVTNLVLRNGLDDVAGKMNVQTGFKTNALGNALGGAPGGLLVSALGSVVAGPLGAIVGNVVGNLFSKVIYKIPVIGDILGGIGNIIGSLFGTKKTVVGGGIYGGPQSFGSIDEMGFAGQSFADIKSTKKFFGLKSGTKYSTQFGDLDDGIEQQFGLLLTSFGDAIKLAAGPLGLDLDAITGKLNGFVVDIGKIDLKGLTGDEIQEKLEAVFGAQADKMAQFAIAGLERFQQVGEGYFETMIRVAATTEAVTNSLDLLGLSAQSLGVDASMGITGFFDSVSDYQSAAGAYFQTYYSDAEQAAAKTAQLGKVFDSLGVTMPDSIANYRALVEAQDLTTAGGQQLYAALLQLAPAFAEVATAGQSAASAAAIMRERRDLDKQLLELNGDTAALRQMEIDQLDPSNRARLTEIYARQDQIAAEQAAAQAAAEARRQAEQAAQEAARAAEQLRQAWASIADGIYDEVQRIRGLTQGDGQNFAQLQGQFNAATVAARAGDQDAAKSLPGLSKALLDIAEQMATSRQELQRVQAMTAASLDQTWRQITGGVPTTTSASGNTISPLWQAYTNAATASTPANDLATEVRTLREEVVKMRQSNDAANASIINNTDGIDDKIDTLMRAGGGKALATREAA